MTVCFTQAVSSREQTLAQPELEIKEDLKFNAPVPSRIAPEAVISRRRNGAPEERRTEVADGQARIRVVEDILNPYRDRHVVTP